MTKKKEALEPQITKEVIIPETKKPVKAKKTKVDAVDINQVTLESYSMKMVIPTGQYANIQPEIVVKAYSVERAHDFIAPHMNKLWKEYYLINDRRPTPTPTPSPAVVSPANACTNSTCAVPIKIEKKEEKEEGGTGFFYIPDPSPASSDTKPLNFEGLKTAFDGKEVPGCMFPDEVQPPASSVALVKATQAINSCLSLEALEIIRAQVDKSTKLTQKDKESLQPLLLERFEAISNGK